jgi:predicted acyl esterase
MQEQRDVLVPMRDGTRLWADVFLPGGEGRFPALVGLSPYGKEIQSLPVPPQPPTSPVYAREIEAGDPRVLTDHGYAHVIADVRGIGKSEGEYRGWMSPDEARDGHDLVEWAAAQPWCDGNVGMIGVSYYGAVQLMVAATRPPHLKAIMPFNAPVDFYREGTHHGGITHVFFNLIYKVKATGVNVSTLVEQLEPAELESLIADLAADPDLQMYPELYNAAIDPKRVPGFFDILAQPFDGPFYWERSANTKYEDIEVPAYCGSGWWAFAHMHLRGAFQNFNGIKAPTKLYIESRVEAAAPMDHDYNLEAVRWYDHWLKGEDTGIMDEPPIRIHVRGSGFREEHEWPLARTQWTKFYLRRWNALSTEPEPIEGYPDSFVQQPPQETAKVQSADYLTPPLLAPVELVGPAALYLHAAIDAEDTNWIVALADIAPNGAVVELTRGYLKASHREVDEERSEPYLPYHPHREAVPVPPGEIIEYAIELSPLANVFRPGHRIRLSITCLDHLRHPPPDLELGAGHLPWHVCRNATVTHHVHHGPTTPSHLLLPVIPAGREGG